MNLRPLHLGRALWLAPLALAVACSGDDGAVDAEDAASGADAADTGVADIFDDASDEPDAGEPPVDPETLWADYVPAPPPIPRLTSDQLDNALRDLFGEDIVIPDVAWDDLSDGGFAAVGAGDSTLSPRTAEDLERAAGDMARQALTEERRDQLMTCEPAGVVDDDCAAAVLSAFGRRAWRRPLTDEELARLVTLSADAANVLGDFYAGLEYGVSGVIQSPHFLYRREVGVLDPDTGWRRYTDLELASRLAFTLWNTIPDEALLAAAESGALSTDEGLREQVQRLLGDERAREGVLTFFRQWYQLDELTHLSKDPQVFTAMSPQLGESARLEALLGLEHVVFETDSDFRELFTTNRTFLDRKLAALYGVPAPSRDGFAEAFLPPDGARRGFLGQAAFLALHSHPVSSSATLRGLFVREKILCSPVGAPPSDVDTSIPEPSGEAPTLRERVAEHLEAESCRGCHLQMDPIGLGFENFDGVGRFREFDTRGGLENPALIDPSGDLDGAPFTDAWELGELVASHPRFGRCVAQSWMRFGTGTIEGLDQYPGVLGLTAEFEQGGFRVLDMIERFVMSPAFRYAGDIEDETEEAQP